MRLGTRLLTPPVSEPITLARARAWLTLDIEGFSGSTLLDVELESMIRGARQWIEHETDRTIGLQRFVATQDSFYSLAGNFEQSLPGNYQLPIQGYDRFRGGAWQLGIELPKGPIRSILEIRYLSPTGEDLVVDPSTYRLTIVEPQRVVLRAQAAWPLASIEPESVRIYYFAGYDVQNSSTTIGDGYATNWADGYAEATVGYVDDYANDYTEPVVISLAPAGPYTLGEDLVAAMRLLIGHFWRNREASVQLLRQLELPLGVRSLLAPNRASVGI